MGEAERLVRAERRWSIEELKFGKATRATGEKIKLSHVGPYTSYLGVSEMRTD